MAEVVKTVRLIMCDVDANNNKFWTGTLYDNDDVYVEWGRVGKAAQSKMHKGEGAGFLDKKEREKLNKGYTPLKTVAVAPGSKSTVLVEQRDLKAIAREQIKTKNPLLDKLVERLVQANVHQITSSTQIQFDASTGLFTTPLGIVTKDGILEAREILATIKKAKNLSDVKTDIANYLRIIPQDIGMKFKVESIFGSSDLIVKQSDLLDSLESSYQALQKPAPSSPSATNVAESIFNVEIDLLTDRKEISRINDKFNATRKSMHSSSRLKVKDVYIVHINNVRTAFETGKVVGNIQELWHGTKKANLLSILKGGLRISPPSTAYISGKMFGNGIYFSDQSTKSLNYAYGYWDGKYENNCFMFLCDVAMGKAYTPSGPTGSLPKPGYDSTYAAAGRSGVMNNEMIVYKENQVDMKYLIEFVE
jgi:poly [ADP-ribose] polymerase